MEVNQKKYLEEKGFDVDGTMKRFLNNETLYLKCLKKFLDDSSFEKLKEGYPFFSKTLNCLIGVYI